VNISAISQQTEKSLKVVKVETDLAWIADLGHGLILFYVLVMLIKIKGGTK
jgi:hypothetical protein